MQCYAASSRKSRYLIIIFEMGTTNLSCNDVDLIDEKVESFSVIEIQNVLKAASIPLALNISISCWRAKFGPHLEKYVKHRQVQIVHGVLDHFYASSITLYISQTFGDAKRTKIRRRASLFYSLYKVRNLPNNIFIRLYRKRIDLLRVIILGLPGTCFAYAPFVFDIALPSKFPAECASIFFYHNYPGIMALGDSKTHSKLDIINTKWLGDTGIEICIPKAASIQGLLSSLHGWIMSGGPFFIESEHENIGSPKSVQEFSEMASLMSLKMMMFVLNNPPKHFESFIYFHFARLRENILHTYRTYAWAINRSSIDSIAFRGIIGDLIPKLEVALPSLEDP